MSATEWRAPSDESWSKQEIPLRHRQHRRRLAGQELAVGAHLVGFGIDLDLGAERVVDHVLLADLAGALDRQHRPAEPPLFGDTLGEGSLRHEQRRAGYQALAEG